MFASKGSRQGSENSCMLQDRTSSEVDLSIPGALSRRRPTPRRADARDRMRAPPARQRRSDCAASRCIAWLAKQARQGHGRHRTVRRSDSGGRRILTGSEPRSPAKPSACNNWISSTAAPAALPFGLESDSRPELSTAAQRFASVLVLMSSACCAPIAITRIRTSERARGSGNCAGAGIFQKPTLEPRSKAIRVPHLFVGALVGPKAKPLSC
jgi:hypothetical protein